MLPYAGYLFLLVGMINLSNIVQLAHGRVFNAQNVWENDTSDYNGYLFDKENGWEAEKIVQKRSIARYIGNTIYTHGILKITRPKSGISIRRGVKDSLKPSRLIEHSLLSHRPKFLRY